MKHLKVIDNPDLLRDETSKALLFNDKEAFEIYKLRQNKRKNLEERINKIEDTLQLILEKLNQRD